MQEANLALRGATALAKGTRFFSPAILEFSGRPVSILISGETVEIKLQAIYKKGLFLWFAQGGHLNIPVLSGLNLGPVIYCKNTGLEALYDEVANTGLMIDLRSAVAKSRASGRKWRRGELIELEIKAPFDTISLLEFPLGLEGEREVTEDEIITRFRIRKTPESRDVIIRNYRWRRNMSGLLPLHSCRVIKNGQELNNLHVDIIQTVSIAEPVSSLSVVGTDRIDIGSHPMRSSLMEAAMSLSLDQPDDEYEIIFISGK